MREGKVGEHCASPGKMASPNTEATGEVAWPPWPLDDLVQGPPLVLFFAGFPLVCYLLCMPESSFPGTLCGGFWRGWRQNFIYYRPAL